MFRNARAFAHARTLSRALHVLSHDGESFSLRLRFQKAERLDAKKKEEGHFQCSYHLTCTEAPGERVWQLLFNVRGTLCCFRPGIQRSG